MRAEDRQIRSRDGEDFILRSPYKADAAALLNYFRCVYAETDNLLRYPEEVKLTEEEEEAFIERQNTSPSGCFLLILSQDGEIAGSGQVAGISDLQRIRHRAECAISIRKKYWHRGLGNLLMPLLIEEARRLGFLQLELSVVEENTSARRLYEKNGFTETGRKPRAFREKDGTFRNLIEMTLILV